MIFLSNSQEGQSLAKRLKCPFVSIKKIKYPDSEVSLRYLGEISKEKKIFYFKFNTKEDLNLQIFDFLNILKDQKKINSIVFPYFPYARSIPFNRGEVKIFKNLIEIIDTHVENIYLVQTNTLVKKFLKDNFKSTRVFFLEVEDLISEYIKKSFKEYILISPDKGALKLVEKVAENNKKEYLFLDKKRLSPCLVKFSCQNQINKKIEGNINKTFLVIDDIISTGKTLEGVEKYLKSQGVKNIKCLVVNNLCHNKDLDFLFLNTIENNKKGIDINDLIFDSLN